MQLILFTDRCSSIISITPRKTQVNQIYTAVTYNYNMVALVNRLFWLAVNSWGRVCCLLSVYSCIWCCLINTSWIQKRERMFEMLQLNSCMQILCDLSVVINCQKLKVVLCLHQFSLTSCLLACILPTYYWLFITYKAQINASFCTTIF